MRNFWRLIFSLSVGLGLGVTFGASEVQADVTMNKVVSHTENSPGVLEEGKEFLIPNRLFRYNSNAGGQRYSISQGVIRLGISHTGGNPYWTSTMTVTFGHCDMTTDKEGSSLSVNGVPVSIHEDLRTGGGGTLTSFDYQIPNSLLTISTFSSWATGVLQFIAPAKGVRPSMTVTVNLEGLGAIGPAIPLALPQKPLVVPSPVPTATPRR